MTSPLTLDQYLSLPLTNLSKSMYITSFKKEKNVNFIFYYLNGYRKIDIIETEAGNLGPIIFGSKEKYYRPISNMNLLFELDKLYDYFDLNKKIIDIDHPIILDYSDDKLHYKNIDTFLAEKYNIIDIFSYYILPECDFNKPVIITEIIFKSFSLITDEWFNYSSLSSNSHPSLSYLALIEADNVIMRIKNDIKIIKDFYELVQKLFLLKKKKLSRNNHLYFYYIETKIFNSKKLTYSKKIRSKIYI